MSYTVQQLISRFRLDMDDLEETYLWTDTEIRDYLDQAQIEFTENVDVIFGTEEMDFSANDEWVPVPDYVTRVRGGSIPGHRPDLYLYNYEEWKRNYIGDWRSNQNAVPNTMITDIEPNQIRVYPIPSTSGTINVDVYRNPKSRVSDGAELEVTNNQQQLAILLMARSIAYRKHDSEAYDVKQADTLENKFYDLTTEFKKRVARKRRRTVAVMYGGI